MAVNSGTGRLLAHTCDASHPRVGPQYATVKFSHRNQKTTPRPALYFCGAGTGLSPRGRRRRRSGQHTSFQTRHGHGQHDQRHHHPHDLAAVQGGKGLGVEDLFLIASAHLRVRPMGGASYRTCRRAGGTDLTPHQARVERCTRRTTATTTVASSPPPSPPRVALASAPRAVVAVAAAARAAASSVVVVVVHTIRIRSIGVAGPSVTGPPPPTVQLAARAAVPATLPPPPPPQGAASVAVGVDRAPAPPAIPSGSAATSVSVAVSVAFVAVVLVSGVSASVVLLLSASFDGVVSAAGVEEEADDEVHHMPDWVVFALVRLADPTLFQPGHAV